MAFEDDLADLLAETYAAFGSSATWTPRSAPPVTLLVVPFVPTPDGAGPQDQPSPEQANLVRVRACELAAAGLMIADPITRGRTPDWQGATLAVFGVVRPIAQRPVRTDPRGLEWQLVLG